MIGLVFSNDLNTCPYIDKYIDILEQNNCEYEVILWNRDNNKRVYPENYIVYNKPMDIHIKRIKKVRGFIGFHHFLNKTISERKYDKLIFLTTFTAVICWGNIRRYYKNRYIFDFRDMSFEQNFVYRKIVQNIINSSAFTCFSSPAFAPVFGNCEYVMAHNFRYRDIEMAKNYEGNIRTNKERIHLLHIGITRGEQYNMILADTFGNDPRFEVSIVGSGNDTESFLEYAKKFSNIHVKGTYNNEEKSEYINKADMLLYYYPCDYNCNKALANKYYDCLIYKKPLVGNKNTYSGKRLAERNLGISVDMEETRVADQIFNYYSDLDTAEFIQSIEEELQVVLQEDRVYLDQIEVFVNA